MGGPFHHFEVNPWGVGNFVVSRMDTATRSELGQSDHLVSSDRADLSNPLRSWSRLIL